MPVPNERRDGTTYLIEQYANLRGVINVVGRQRRSDDLACIGVHSDVQLTP